VDGYLFFDDVTPATRDGLFDLVEEELLAVAAVSVSGSAGAFAGYEAHDVRTAYATVEAVVDVVGRPAQRLLAVNPRKKLRAPRPGHRHIADDSTVAIALLPVPLSRAEEVAHVAIRVVGEDRIGVAVVLGGAGTVLVEVDGATLEELEGRLANVLAVAGVASADVMITVGGLGRGWGEAAQPSGAGAHALHAHDAQAHDAQAHDAQAHDAEAHDVSGQDNHVNAEPSAQAQQAEAPPRAQYTGIEYPANG
jgi:hypothetical protein